METYDRRGRHRWTGTSGRVPRRRPGRRKRGTASRPAFQQRRRRGALTALLVLLAIAAVGAGGGWWWYTRPASLHVQAWPDDALITFEGIDYIGDCSLDAVAPGPHRIEVDREGFETYEATVDLKRLHTTELDVRLEPLPQELAVSSNPSGAEYRIEASDGTVLVGETPWVGQLPAGPTVLTLSMQGFNDYRREMMLDSTQTVTCWMDPEGQLVHCLDVWECGPAPKGAAFTPDGSQIWVTLLAGPPSVQVFDTATRELLGEITLGDHGAVEVVFSGDGKFAYVSQMETALVYEIDIAARRVTRTFDTQSAWSKVVELADGTLYVSNWSGDDVSEIDIETGRTLRRLPTADTPRGLYVTKDGRYLYVAGFGTGTLEKIDLEDGSRRTVYSGGVAIRHLVADEERDLLYASDMGADEVLVVDLATDDVRHLAATDEKPNTIDLSPDGKVLFVSCRGANNPASYHLPGPEWGSVLLIDTATGKPLDAVVGGNQPTALDVSPDGRMFVFSDFLDDRLRLYEVPDYEVLAAGGGGLYEAHFEMIKK